MIATRLHAKRHSTATLHRTHFPPVRHDSHLHPIANIDDNDDDDIHEEFDETTQVQLTSQEEKRFFFFFCVMVNGSEGIKREREHKIQEIELLIV